MLVAFAAGAEELVVEDSKGLRDALLFSERGDVTIFVLPGEYDHDVFVSNRISNLRIAGAVFRQKRRPCCS